MFQMFSGRLVYEHDSGLGGGWADLLSEGMHVKDWWLYRSVQYVIQLPDVNGELLPYRYSEFHSLGFGGQIDR